MLLLTSIYSIYLIFTLKANETNVGSITHLAMQGIGFGFTFIYCKKYWKIYKEVERNSLIINKFNIRFYSNLLPQEEFIMAWSELEKPTFINNTITVKYGLNNSELEGVASC